MLYCPCWGRMLLELLFFALMRRFTLQTGIAIFAMLLVYLVFPCGAVAQDGQSADSSTELVAATAHHTGALAQQTSADTPPAPAAAAPEPQSSDVLTLFPHSETSRYWISGQANIVLQWHGRFPAAYSGTNSLKPVPENATSKVYTLFLGYELTHTTEVYLDVESAGGHGLSNALGLAGFTNLDVVRNPSLGDVPYLARLMLRQIIPLSKERVTVERGLHALTTSLPARRLEFRLGKFTIPDFFDANTYGTDSHLQFLNWTVDNDGAYDYAANTRGYTDGAILEYDDHWFSARFGVMLMPKVANGIYLDADIARARGENLEFDTTGNWLLHRSGTVRFLSYLNIADMGNYEEANANFLNGQGSIPSISSTAKQGRTRAVARQGAPDPGTPSRGRLQSALDDWKQSSANDDRYRLSNERPIREIADSLRAEAARCRSLASILSTFDGQTGRPNALGPMLQIITAREHLDSGTAEFGTLSDNLAATLSKFFDGLDTNWDRVDGAVDWSQEMLDLLGAVPRTPVAMALISTTLEADAITEPLTEWFKTCKALLSWFLPPYSNELLEAIEAPFSQASQFLSRLVASAGEAEEWVAFTDETEWFRDAGLDPLVDECAAQTVERRPGCRNHRASGARAMGRFCPGAGQGPLIACPFYRQGRARIRVRRPRSNSGALHRAEDH